MKNFYHHLERIFEKVSSTAITILGNSITFIIAFFLVIYWLSDAEFRKDSLHSQIHDLLLGITFLSLFLIQKSFNRFSASLHLKVNELVSSHEPASNTVINTEEKTERELNLLSKEYIDAKEIEKLIDEIDEKTDSV